MVELSTSQAISSTTTNELNDTHIIELSQIIPPVKTNIEPQYCEPAEATVALAQVGHNSASKFDQLRVADVLTNHASTSSAFQSAPKTTRSLTSSASREESDTTGLGHTEPIEINLCKNICLGGPQQQLGSEQTSASRRDISSPKPSTSTPKYQLRALKGDKSSIEEDNLWSKNFNVPSLSSDLIDETLNYFVNCRHRLGQITKTFDDSDAYILLLQEKEMDLELVARIGQDLLKQFNEVKDSNEALKDELVRFQELNEQLRNELAKCQEDNQQLRYELSSKVSLLDTFMEEEETHLHHRDASTAATQHRFDANDEEFQSLRSQSDRAASSMDNILYKRLCELQDELLNKDEILFKQSVLNQERNIHLEVQLRESERRLSGLEAENETLRENQKELYEELKTYSRNFAELLRIFSESQRNSRAHEVGNISFDSFSEPPTSLEPNLNGTTFTQNLHYDTQQHHATCFSQIGQPTSRDNRGGMIMSSSLQEELQESLLKSGELLVNDDDDLATDEHNEAEDESDGIDRMVINKASPTSSPSRHHRSYYKQARQPPNYYQNHRNHQDHTRRRNQDSDSGGASDGADSGLHTTNISSSTTPINNGLNLDTDSDLDANLTGAPDSEGATNKKNWLGLSTFTLTTLLLICLSATLNTTTNSNLAQKLQQIKFDR